MRLPASEISSDPFMELEGRLISCRDGFLTLQEDRNKPNLE